MGLLDKAAREKNKTAGRPGITTASPRAKKDAAAVGGGQGREQGSLLPRPEPELIEAMIADFGGIGEIAGVRIARPKAARAAPGSDPAAPIAKALGTALGAEAFLFMNSAWILAFCDPELPWEPGIYAAQLGTSLRRSIPHRAGTGDLGIEVLRFQLSAPRFSTELARFIGE